MGHNMLPREVDRTTKIREYETTFEDTDGVRRTSYGTREIDVVTEIVEHECPECGYDRAERERYGDTVERRECRLCGIVELYPGGDD